MTKPFKTYNGGKAGNGTYQQIINNIPKHDLFVDAMVGNGGIFLNLKRPGVTVINDVDGSVIKRFRDLIAKNDDYGHKDSLIVENDDYAGIIAKYECAADKVFFYFDPPYLKETRKSQRDLYKFEWEEEDHLRFLQAAVTVKSDVMISHYPCNLYNKALTKWRTHDFESQTRNGKAIERIYMNYSKPEVLQDFSYLGNDYRERQRIKRKIQRQLQKLKEMPADERTGILSAVIAKYDVTSAIILKSQHQTFDNGYKKGFTDAAEMALKSINI